MCGSQLSIIIWIHGSVHSIGGRVDTRIGADNLLLYFDHSLLVVRLLLVDKSFHGLQEP